MERFEAVEELGAELVEALVGVVDLGGVGAGEFDGGRVEGLGVGVFEGVVERFEDQHAPTIRDLTP